MDGDKKLKQRFGEQTGILKLFSFKEDSIFKILYKFMQKKKCRHIFLYHQPYYEQQVAKFRLLFNIIKI